MSERRPDRQADARRLRRSGMSRADIAEELGVHRQSVWRWTRGVEPSESSVTPVTPAPAQGGPETGAQAQDGRIIDWPGDLVESVGVMRDKARGGSVTAARDLARLAAAEIRQTPACQNHVDGAEANAMVGVVHSTWQSYMMDTGARRLAHVTDARLDLVIEEMDKIVDDVSAILNQLRAEAQEGG